jgi:thioredoxin-dependent peroxiredoxin
VLKIGDVAPAFDVEASGGRRVKLADYAGKKNVVLFFYPRDFTRIYTAEVCGFRDMYEDMAGGDTEVIGVSLNDADSHKKFAEMHKVPYPLVADTDKVVAKAYGAVGALRGILGMAKRITFVIDKSGKIAGIFEAELNADTHIDGVKGTLAKLSAA